MGVKKKAKHSVEVVCLWKAPYDERMGRPPRGRWANNVMRRMLGMDDQIPMRDAARAPARAWHLHRNARPDLDFDNNPYLP